MRWVRFQLDADYLYLNEPRIVSAEEAGGLWLSPRVGAHLTLQLVAPEGSPRSTRTLVGRSLRMFGSGRSRASSPYEFESTVGSDLTVAFRALPPALLLMIINEVECPDGEPLRCVGLAPFTVELCWSPVLEAASRNQVPVPLVDGLILHGEARDEGGDPIQGARVCATCNCVQGNPGAMYFYYATTGPGGRFELYGLPPGLTKLSARHDQYAPASLEGPASLGSGLERRDLDFVMHRK